MVRIGSKRERITIERRTPGADAYGDFMEETWATLTEVWAAVKVVRGREFTAQEKTTDEVSHRFFIRYSTTTAGVTAKDRVAWRSENHDIVSVVDIDGRKREMEIATKVRT